jgi:hypothetical protein
MYDTALNPVVVLDDRLSERSMRSRYRRIKRETLIRF